MDMDNLTTQLAKKILDDCSEKKLVNGGLSNTDKIFIIGYHLILVNENYHFQVRQKLSKLSHIFK